MASESQDQNKAVVKSLVLAQSMNTSYSSWRKYSKGKEIQLFGKEEEEELSKKSEGFWISRHRNALDGNMEGKEVNH